MEVSATILINKDNKVLMAKRPEDGSACSGRWEFPGGKRKRAESLEKCAIRECMEELGVEIKIDDTYHVDRHLYTQGVIELVFFLGHIVSGEVEMRVHTDLAWYSYDELEGVAACPGDERLIQRLITERPSYRG